MINGKQRAYLRGLANPIDTILYIGKGGITAQVEKQADDALTARELIKGKVLENSDITSRQAADILSEKLDTEVVQVIGSKFVLYRANPDEPQIELPKIKKK
jgi:RNA-binding protein